MSAGSWVPRSSKTQVKLAPGFLVRYRKRNIIERMGKRGAWGVQKLPPQLRHRLDVILKHARPEAAEHELARALTLEQREDAAHALQHDQAYVVLGVGRVLPEGVLAHVARVYRGAGEDVHLGEIVYPLAVVVPQDVDGWGIYHGMSVEPGFLVPRVQGIEWPGGRGGQGNVEGG